MSKPIELIISEIDTTLDQLIHNAQTLQKIASDSTFTQEIHALQKVQESLLARLLHMNDFLDAKRRISIEESNALAHADFKSQLATFTKLNAEMIDHVSDRMDHNKHKAKVRIRRHRLKVRKLAD